MQTTNPKINVTDLRQTYREVFEAVSQRGQRYEVLCHGEVVGFIIGPAEWNMMNETLDVLSNLELIQQVIESEHDIEKDLSRPAEEVFEEIEEELDA